MLPSVCGRYCVKPVKVRAPASSASSPRPRNLKSSPKLTRKPLSSICNARSCMASDWPNTITSSPKTGVSSLASSAKPRFTVKLPEILSMLSVNSVAPLPLMTNNRSAREITVNSCAFHARLMMGLPLSKRINPLVSTKPSPPCQEAF